MKNKATKTETYSLAFKRLKTNVLHQLQRYRVKGRVVKEYQTKN